jgi:hypothetical protein
MNLTKNSFHAKFYDFIYQKNLPKSLCDYFWALIFGIILLPLLLPFNFIFIQKWSPFSHTSITSRLILNFVWTVASVFLFIIMLYLPIFENNYGGPLAVLIVGLIIGAVKLAIYLHEKYRESRYDDLFEPKKENEFLLVLKTGFKAFKEKYCPRIDWKD